MGSNYIAQDATIYPSVDCVNDSSVGYAADFSKNGEVDGWEYFDNIHTYGSWDGFLFGTLYGEYGTIGRYNVFLPVDAITHYFIRIVMKYNPWPRDDRGNHPLPTRGKLRWRSLQATNWDDDKEIYFDIEPDNNWHTYIINAGIAQWWQGDINDLRIWPVTENGEDGDEFFIRAVDIFSTESHKCRNSLCEKYSEYSHPCPWIGVRPSIESDSNGPDAVFNIDNLTEFIVNINGYGNEVVKVGEVLNGSGTEVANALAKAISRTNIGGYAEVEVRYTTDYTFIIYVGNAHEAGSIEITDNDLSRYLKFYNNIGQETTNKISGETPVNGYSPLSSFKIKSHQALGLLDNSETTAITFNPFQYSVEGGRRDWLTSSTGLSTIAYSENEGDISTQPVRKYHAIDNEAKTIIDYNHPFNASGRITKIWIQCTLDDPNYVKSEHEVSNVATGETGSGSRKGEELSGAKVMIVRPKRDGTVQVIYEWPLTDRDPDRSYYDPLYSLTQETIDLDVDVFINKGDMIAVYNANMYIGKSVSGLEYDCQYYQVDFEAEVGDVFNPGRLYGDGSAGLLVYSHGEEPQRRLYLDIDLGHRYNIEKIELKGKALNSILEYNIARCLDINWQCELFGEYHLTSHARIDLPGRFVYQRYNVHFGIDNLNDGVYNVPDGLACDSYSLTTNLSAKHWNPDAGPGVVPVNPRYFWVNGDEEWLGVWLHAGITPSLQSVDEFDEDPIAIYLHFPFEKQKKIYKSKIYFKEKYNFRSFSLSTYRGFYDTLGNADDNHYDLVPEYTKVTLDNVEYYDGSPTYYLTADYLFTNPSQGAIILEPTSNVIYEWDPVLSDVIQDYTGNGQYGQQSGYFTTQHFQAANADQWNSARKVDWQILEHQWEPITCKGFRVFTDFHKSTKIMEMELYGVAEDIGSNLSGGVVMTFSDYQETWWPTESAQISEELVEIFIGDSPRYFTLELIPVTETRYDDIVINVKTEDIDAGEKGCEYIYYSESSKTGTENDGQLVTMENVYGKPYDLYVDINPEELTQEGLLFYSQLNNIPNINNPVVGPDAGYYKFTDYPLLNQDYNCAINCHTFGLQNLIEGAPAHFSYNDMLNWSSFGPLSNGESIDFENLPLSSRTTIFLPELSRSRYWKFGLLNKDLDINIREVRAYDLDNNLLDPEFYHDLNKSFLDGYVDERAPHLENISVVGSYYVLAEDQYITMDLGSQIPLGRIELFHDGLQDYVNFERTEDPIVGVDKYTKMCVRAWKDNTGSYLQDVSYFEHDVTMHGSAHVDVGTDDSNIALDVDFGCTTALTEWAERTDYPYPHTNTASGTEFNPVSASGTVTSGTCEFPGYLDFNVRCHDIGNDRFYYDMREDEAEAYKLFHQVPFEITFAIELNSYTPGGRDGHGGTYQDYQPAVSVGAINGRRRKNSNFFAGPQMWFAPPSAPGSNGTFAGRFGLAIRQNTPFTIDYYSPNSPNNYTSTYVNGLELDTKYYCKLTCYGNDTHRDTDDILYRAEVWTDAIDGANLIVDLTRTTNIYWEANEFAIGGGALQPTTAGVGSPSTYGCGSVEGTVYDMKLTLDHDVKPYPWRDEEITDKEKCSIRIPAGSNNYVKVENSIDMDVRRRYHTHDFWVKFRTLPAPGVRWTIMEQYDYDNPVGAGRSWRLALYCASDGSYYRWEWWVNQGSENSYNWYLAEYNGQTGYSRYVNHFNIVKDKWYFMVFTTGTQYDPGGFILKAFFDISGRATFNSYYPGVSNSIYDIPAGNDIIIGKDFDGWICEPRISRSDNDLGTNHGGNRYSNSWSYANQWRTPTKPYTRMYPFSFYVSDTNITFGHYANVDAQFTVTNPTDYLPYLYHSVDNEFAEQYNTYFAIDLSHRYNIDIVRRYGSNDDHLIDIAANVMYSNVDTDDPFEAFMSEPTFDTDDDFYGYETFLDEERWYLSDSIKGRQRDYLMMRNGRLEQTVNSDMSNGSFFSTFGIRGDFDIEVTVDRSAAPDESNWWAWLKVFMSNEVKSDIYTDSSETYVYAMLQYQIDTGSPYYRVRGHFVDGGTSYDSTIPVSSDEIRLKIQREGFHFYTKYYEDGVWKELDDRPVHDAKGKDVTRIQMGLACDNGYPTTKVYWRNFKINHADRVVLRSRYWDARWMVIEMLNGDSTSRNLDKLGIYPDMSDYVCPDGHNYNTLGWEDLGPSVTGYSTGDNVALDTAVSGSSYVGVHFPSAITNGIIDNERENAWLSDNELEQWVTIDLGEQKEIYRVKVYHGYSTGDDDFIIEDYKIESSIDNQSFTTRWTITGNDSWERTHDSADPFTARYVRFYVDSYRADNQFMIKDAEGIDYYRWHGACLREVEVYEYYGYSYVSSEEWPIIAINLRDQFYIQGHEMTGLYTEYNSFDWSNDSSNFAWSDFVLEDPKKVRFGDWGADPGYEQWVAIRRDTASWHNPDPGQAVPTGREDDSPDYLKHVIIKSTSKENPIDYPWWWSSLISTVSRDYSHAVVNSTSSLKISYPASSALDTVRFIEGSNWGVDSVMAYRDGLSFRWYIEDEDKIDTTEGYVFFGGSDGTDVPQPIEYRWYLSTLSGTDALITGWNNIFLRTSVADEIIYDEEVSKISLIQPLMQEYSTWHTFGIKFRGKGEPFTMNIDGNIIHRNHFADSSKFDFGLYLAGSDYLDIPLSEIDLKAGTVEFWLRPDYSFGGLDVHRRFKNRSIFHMGNVNNDVFGFMINSSGFNIYYGNVASDLRALLVEGVPAEAIDNLFHMAVVFSANGLNIGSGRTIEFYLNNGLLASINDPWRYTDEKYFKFTVGGKAPLGLIEHSSSLKTTSVDGVISNLRIYNYCKSDFTDSMNNTFSEYSGDLLLPAKMIEISQDNVTYYKVGDIELPFVYEKVPAGDKVEFYVRSEIPEGLTGQESRTAGIITSWDIGV